MRDPRMMTPSGPAGVRRVGNSFIINWLGFPRTGYDNIIIRSNDPVKFTEVEDILFAE